MGTRADFYIKEAKESELTWLGSIAWDGYPSGIDAAVLKSKDKKSFIKNLTKFLAPREDHTHPEMGWPWEDSSTTDYAYCFHDGKVYANCFGSGWHSPFSKAENPKIIWKHAFPNMKSIQRVDMGKRSGIMLIGG